ncbi:MAG: PAS domain-containing sensor histidine kinase [Rhodospirillaceae bacterium]|jgi:two-component system, NtrC family, nitrogen regulation sensor histidine kinase NtrY|nr:PAS domain-containing sensor histidine kinase [Rhodospirillaceae bacterium]
MSAGTQLDKKTALADRENPMAAGVTKAGLSAWARRTHLARKLAYALTVAAAISGIATYVALSRSSPLGPDPDTILVLLNIDLIILLTLGAVVARRIVQVWIERRRGSAGSRLHVRLVMLFSLVAVTPAIVVAVASVLFLNFGVQAWFSDRVRTALSESLAVADAYLEEHQQTIRADILAMGHDLIRENPAIWNDRDLLDRVLSAHASLRGLPEAVIFDGSTQVIGRSGLSYALEFDPVPVWAIEKAREGEVAIMTNDREDRVRALVQLDRLVDTFLYVGRFVDASVINHVERTQEAVSVYQQLEGRRSGLQINFAMMFAVLALLLLLAAVWVGLMFATQLARPVSALIEAAERVRTGDLSARVAESEPEDELGSLSRAFNRMTSQLETQRQELVEANQQLDLRRRFTEAVLGGVSAGVIGLDRDGQINLPNRSASALLSTDIAAEIGHPLRKIAPEFAGLIRLARQRTQGFAEAQIKVERAGRSRTFLARATVERSAGGIVGYVVTFDDISELLSAQRKAAWADVARRIAHEIKNPLTPIQLSAERLKRKYLDEIKSDPETFVACTDTIVRQVGDIGRMVDEFSAFARMPAPVMKVENLGEVCREAFYLQRTANPEIAYTIEGDDAEVPLRCDRRQVTQALTNLLQNAADSIDGRESTDGGAGGESLPKGRIELAVLTDRGDVEIAVRDNGRGLPKEERDRLTEPYVTTRAKGTGLGLAIVKKIMEDHAGDLMLADRPEGGAEVRLVFDVGGDKAAKDKRRQEQQSERKSKTASHVT